MLGISNGVVRSKGTLELSDEMDPTVHPAVTTMSNSGSYPVTLVALQHYSSTPVNRSYSSHSRTDNPPLTTTLGLVSIHSLPHLAVYPARSLVLHVLNISCTLYHFHQTWFILPRPDLVLSPVIPCPLFRLFTCHHKYSVDYPVFFSLKSTIVIYSSSCPSPSPSPLDRNLCKGSTLIVLSC